MTQFYFKKEIISSFYGKKFHGKRTANGEHFNKYDMTAAHKTLPFGTKVLVRNPRNDKSIIVRINDRGPYVKGRELDLSERAAKEIGITLGRVEIYYSR